MKRTSKYLVAFSLGVNVLALLCLVGCGREEAPAKPQAPARKVDPPSVYMKDPAFRKTLSDARCERNELARTRNELVARMEKMVDAVKAKMPGAADAAVKLALEKDAEWNSLYKRVADLGEAIDDNRRHLAEKVRERIAAKPAAPVAKPAAAPAASQGAEPPKPIVYKQYRKTISK